MKMSVSTRTPATVPPFTIWVGGLWCGTERSDQSQVGIGMLGEQVRIECPANNLGHGHPLRSG